MTNPDPDFSVKEQLFGVKQGRWSYSRDGLSYLKELPKLLNDNEKSKITDYAKSLIGTHEVEFVIDTATRPSPESGKISVLKYKPKHIVPDEGGLTFERANRPSEHVLSKFVEEFIRKMLSWREDQKPSSERTP